MLLVELRADSWSQPWQRQFLAELKLLSSLRQWSSIVQPINQWIVLVKYSKLKG